MEGKRIDAGKWDLYVILLDRYHIFPDEVNAQDPEFIDELLIFLRADADHTKKIRDKHGRE